MYWCRACPVERPEDNLLIPRAPSILLKLGLSSACSSPRKQSWLAGSPGDPSACLLMVRVPPCPGPQPCPTSGFHFAVPYPLLCTLNLNRAWRDGSEVRNTCCSCKGAGFGLSAHLTSQDPGTPVPGDLTLFTGLGGHQAHTWCTYIHAGQTPTHIKGRKSTQATGVSTPPRHSLTQPSASRLCVCSEYEQKG